MADFSRPPSEMLEQSLHKGYVGLHIEQGVPVLDRDLNLLHDLIASTVRLIVSRYIGDGISVGSEAFEIRSILAEPDMATPESANDFCILPGKSISDVCLVDGVEVRNFTRRTYRDQGDVPELTTPTREHGSIREDIVHLDVFLSTVDGSKDRDLLNGGDIGMQTSVRLRPSWTVRVVEGRTKPPAQVPPGHTYLPLALLRREPGNPEIEPGMIEDLRRPILALSDIERRLDRMNRLLMKPAFDADPLKQIEPMLGDVGTPVTLMGRNLNVHAGGGVKVPAGIPRVTPVTIETAGGSVTSDAPFALQEGGLIPTFQEGPIEVVADRKDDSSQPWIDLPITLTFEADVGHAATRSLQISNSGTGTLTISDREGFQPGPGLVLTTVPPSIKPNACANLEVTFTGVTGSTTVQAVHDVTSNDTKAKVTAGHNHRVTLTATTRLAPGTILLADRDAAGADGHSAGGVILVDPQTGKQARLSFGERVAAPSSVAIEASGTILVAREGSIVRINPLMGEQAILAYSDTLGRFHVGLAVEDDGQILVTHTGRRGHGRGELIRVHPDTGATTVLTSSKCDLAGVAVDVDGSILVVEQGMSPDKPRDLLRVDRRTGRSTVLTTFDPPCRPVGLAVEPGGGILVTDAVSADGTGRLIRVDPTMNKTVLSTGQFFRAPWGIAVDHGGSILVSDHEAFGHKGGVIRVHPQTGVQTKVSAGGMLVSPLMIVIVPQDERPIDSLAPAAYGALGAR
ncbi:MULTISPECIES: hypothetical protein [unclassified Nonomuraea]|uniref:hypothetical protein n=1 Tax=unclassified Nonomuraea TaxID=2593643 RepID=UPI0033DD7171